jgi:hypothetical protein
MEMRLGSEPPAGCDATLLDRTVGLLDEQEFD